MIPTDNTPTCQQPTWTFLNVKADIQGPPVFQKLFAQKWSRHVSLREAESRASQVARLLFSSFDRMGWVLLQRGEAAGLLQCRLLGECVEIENFFSLSSEPEEVERVGNVLLRKAIEVATEARVRSLQLSVSLKESKALLFFADRHFIAEESSPTAHRLTLTLLYPEDFPWMVPHQICEDDEKEPSQ